MPRTSAGLLIHRVRDAGVEVFLVHPGGPFWAKKDLGAWSMPKGEYVQGEDPFEVARRELKEETGLEVEGDFVKLEPIRQSGGKIVTAWAVEADFDPGEIASNTFEVEWPPRSGQFRTFPEVDRAEWFAMAQARHKILPSQAPLLDQLERLLANPRTRRG